MTEIKVVKQATTRHQCNSTLLDVSKSCPKKMYSVDRKEVPRVKQANIQQYDQALESTAAITHKNYVVYCEGACGNYARVLLPRSARHVALHFS
jgi:hypothetical protein